MTGPETFCGIPVAAEAFLGALAANNTVAWFAAHRNAYEDDVREPLRRLVDELALAMLAIDPGIDVSSTGAVSRIRRDVRFSRDKSPFRVTQWIVFKHRRKDWTSRPAFFMECGPDICRTGMGFYDAGSRVMAALRDLAQEQPTECSCALRSAENAGFALAGDVYKRPRVPLDQPLCVQELHRRKNVCMLRPLETREVFGNAELTAMLRAGFTAAAPLYEFWSRASDRAAGAGGQPS